jgi:colanic acid biosynthesis glycosyl transferase WcaI
LLKMERMCYAKAHSVVVYSEGNKEHVVRIGAKGQVYIIPNWTDISTKVSHNEKYSFRKEEAIATKFVISYAGTMQQAQGLEIVLETACILNKYEDIIFLLAGEGASKPVLKGLINEKNIKNVLLRPIMPREHYRQFLHESDVCLITLSPEIPLETVPGKLADIMGHGKPIILVANLCGDAAKIIHKAKCGFCIRPGDSESLACAVLNLYKDGDLRRTAGENARLFAGLYFTRALCTRKYEEVLIQAV